MPPSLVPLDLLNLLFLPLMAITAVSLRANWRQLWDEDLTAHDRQLIQRIAIFLLLPVVVFFHELGHVAAVRLFGGKVAEFHYAFLSGYVVPAGHFTADEKVWLYFAGNLVQILIGLVAALAAALVSSPPVVALLVYLSLWSVGGTVILYTLLSVTGLYGDWIHIYTAPPSALVAAIALSHLTLALAVVYAVYAEKPRLWFAAKTDPGWAAENRLMVEHAGLFPSADNLVRLGWSYYFKGLNKTAVACLEAARQVAPESPDVRIFEAALADERGRTGKAIQCYQELIGNPDVPERLRLLAMMSLGRCLLRHGRRDQALATFIQAGQLAPDAADPRYFIGALLSEAGRLDEAEGHLRAAAILEWMDKGLAAANAGRLADIQKRRQSKQ